MASVDQQAYDRLIATRAIMVNTMPFWGLITMELDLVEDNTKPTMAVDGRTIYYNAGFVNALYECDPDELVFVIAHETLHCVYSHVGIHNRINGRNIRVWNWATDYYINDELITDKVGTFPTVITGLYDPRFTGMSSEEIYNVLEQELEDNYGDDWENKVDTVANGGCTDCPDMDKIVNDRERKVMDQHLTDGGDGDEQKPTKSPEEWKDVLSDISENLREAGDTSTTMPKGIRLIMSEMTESKVDWRKYVHRLMRTIVLRRRTYNKIKKYSVNLPVVMPHYGVKSRKLDLHVAVDTSGSVGVKQLSAFVTELVAILKLFPHVKITLIPFDEIVYEDHVVEIDKENGDIEKLVADVIKPCLIGGGGTLFEAVWGYLKYKRVKPDLLMLFTDGMPARGWGDPTYCNTMFLIVNKHPTGRPLFGSVVKVEDI